MDPARCDDARAAHRASALRSSEGAPIIRRACCPERVENAIRRADVARYYSPKYAPEKAHAASKPVMTPRSSGGR